MATNNALALFDPAAMPAHVVEAMEKGESNIITQGGMDSLLFTGKVWSISLGGVKRPLTRKNEEGEDEPIPVFSAIVLAYPERRGRAYYDTPYNPEKETVPACWSNDGVISDPNSPKRQAEKCAKCPMSAKNSKVTENGKGTVACGQHRMVAVIPASRIGDFPPLRLKLAITSDWDGQGKDQQAQGWFGFQNYMDFLKSKNVPFTYDLTTRIKFDPSVAYPKLLFSPGKWLTKEQRDLAADLSKAHSIETILKTEYTPPRLEDDASPAGLEDELEAPVTVKIAGIAGKASKAAPVDEDEAEAPVVVKTAGKAPKAAPVVEDDELEAPIVSTPAKPASNPKAEAAAKAAAARKAAPQVPDDGDDEPVAPVAKPKAGSGKAAATPPVASSAAVNEVMGEWDD